jgi:hypothetical protein
VLGEFRIVVSIFEVSEVFLESDFEGLPVCPVYFILQSGQVSWYMPLLSYLLWSGPCFVARRLSIVLSMVNVTLTFVFLKSVVINLVSFPIYVCVCMYVCIYIQRIKSDLCHLQHKLIGFYNRDEKCLQRGTDWVFK